ncbi:MAG: ATP-dependent DNA helicase RecG [Coxiellaceae bacterium]|nr:ATP-dependent DNA helicase RecG [Coxiellaceae bacterium]
MASIPIITLKGVGAKNAERLSQLSLLSVQDLLFHLPFRYEDRTRVHHLNEIKPGDRVLVEGKVQSVDFFGPKKYVRCVISDDTNRHMDIVFFQLGHYHEKNLSQAKGILRFFGEVQIGFSGHLQMAHPEYAPVARIEQDSLLSLSPCLLPVYAATKGLSQIALRKLMRQALSLLDKNILPELLPDSMLKQFSLFQLTDALRWVHFPPTEINMTELMMRKHPAQQRLIMEELMAHQLHLHFARHTVKKNAAIALAREERLCQQLLSQLPFQLTSAQTRVLDQIENDLLKNVPMLRLVQGDVGSGKTIVACMAALSAIAKGYQVALMAPTEILAEQHYQNFLKWLSPLNITVALLTGKQGLLQQRETKTRLLSGDIQFIIGTHALFQDAVAFKNLALFIIDEQHRFGVQQRLALMEKGANAGFFPHQLIMTATPIPRTLAMTAYADLDVSVIDELPPGRQPITTVLIGAEKRADIIARVHAHCLLKKQAYWICTLIDESDILECQAAETTAQELCSKLSGLHVGLVHGRLKTDEKKAVMADFQSGKIDVLVATTVVEVGVDVPNASLMIIENPERLGLSQLHQLRGRVGRGKEASYCVLLYRHPLSTVAKQRLSVMRESQDGFWIAEQDFQLRGPGDVLGVRQSGLMQLRVADLARDEALLPTVQLMAQALSQDHADIAALLTARWIGAAEKYLQA